MTAIKRGMTKQEAADYCGCQTLAAFDDWRRKGIVPGPIPGTNNFDRKLIDIYLDRASEIVKPSEEMSPYQRWKAGNADQSETAQT